MGHHESKKIHVAVMTVPWVEKAKGPSIPARYLEFNRGFKNQNIDWLLFNPSWNRYLICLIVLACVKNIGEGKLISITFQPVI